MAREASGLSAHADQEQLLAWVSHFKSPRTVILTHGELGAALTLQKLIEDKFHFNVVVAEKNEIFDLGGAE